MGGKEDIAEKILWSDSKNKLQGWWEPQQPVLLGLSDVMDKPYSFQTHCRTSLVLKKNVQAWLESDKGSTGRFISCFSLCNQPNHTQIF